MDETQLDSVNFCNSFPDRCLTRTFLDLNWSVVQVEKMNQLNNEVEMAKASQVGYLTFFFFFLDLVKWWL